MSLAVFVWCLWLFAWLYAYLWFMCLHGDCFVFVCVFGNVCVVIVGVCMGVCMFVAVCACVVVILCLYVSLAMFLW